MKRVTLVVFSFIAAVAVAAVPFCPALAQETSPPAPAPAPPPAQEPAPAPAPAQQPAPAVQAAPAPQVPALAKATVVIDGRAKSDGVIELQVGATPETLKSIRITVANKMEDKEIARDIEKEVKVALGATYKVSQFGSKVEIKAPKKQTFRIAIGSVTPLGVAVKVR